METVKASDPEVVAAKLISGRLVESDIPDIRPKIVRVYFCSSGTGTLTERTALLDKVYLPLREYCRLHYGLELQVLDMGWGLPPDCPYTSVFSGDFRHENIRRCQQLSDGPSFLVFLGQKYGASQAQPSILADEYEVIRMELHNSKSRECRNHALLDRWYQKDWNSVPPAYRLRPVASVISDFQAEDEERRGAAQREWQEDERELTRLLRRGSELAYMDGRLDMEATYKYSLSELDQEVQAGMESCDSPQRRCLLLVRSIVDLKNYVEDFRAERFAELALDEIREKLQLDADAADMLEQLHSRARSLISPDNTLSYEVLWRYEDVIHPKLHKDYLDSLCEDVGARLRDMLDEVGVQKPPWGHDAGLLEEPHRHWHHCRDRAAVFLGQAEVMANIQQYVAERAQASPLIVTGPPGCGKTKIMAKAAMDMPKLLSPGGVTIVRFIGLTQESTDLRHLLRGICAQLTLALNRGDPGSLPTDALELSQRFTDLLTSVPSETEVVVLLDAVHNLSSDHNAHLMLWLPSKLPPNVKIVASILPQAHDILPRLRAEIICYNRIIELAPLSLEEGQVMLLQLLALKGRKLTPAQQGFVKSALAKCSEPLAIHLLAEEASTIPGWADESAFSQPDSLEDAMHALFQRLEDRHGTALVKRSLSYMSASVKGLSDVEMEDLLSLDDEVLDAVFKDFHPQLRRFPLASWLLLKKDLEPFLYQFNKDGVTVSNWTCTLFSEIITRRYMANEAQRRDVHSHLADYFLGTWAGQAKPIPPPPQTPNGLVLRPCGDKADRKVISQPLTFEVGERRAFNKRKFDQVPRHLQLSGRQVELSRLVLFNYDWLYSKLAALSLQHIMQDFELNPGTETTLVQSALRVAQSSIEQDINNLGPELVGHLLPYYTTNPNVMELLRQCDIRGPSHCALSPAFPYTRVPGSALRHTLTCPAPPDFLTFFQDDRYLLTKQRENCYVQQWDLLTGEMKASIFTSVGDLYVTPNGRYFVIVDHVTEMAIKVHNSDTGAFIDQIIILNHLTVKPHEAYRQDSVCLTDERLCTVVTTDCSYLCISDVPSVQLLQVVELDGRAAFCHISPDGSFVVCNSNQHLLVYDLATLDHVSTSAVDCTPSLAAFSPDSRALYLSSHTVQKLWRVTLRRGVVEMFYCCPLDRFLDEESVTALAVSPNGLHVLLRAQNRLIITTVEEDTYNVLTRPTDIPSEFKLPNSPPDEIVFTNAEFSRNSEYVVATVFRHVLVWEVASWRLVSSVQAPVGILSSLLVSQQRPQLVTHIRHSPHLQVWAMDAALHVVNMLDKLTSPVRDIQVSVDNSVAYVSCEASDEVGVIDMRTGFMLDLLTHKGLVMDVAISPTGLFCLVASRSKHNEAFKLWNMNDRQVVKEWGLAPGYCVGMNCSNALIAVAPTSRVYQAPYYVKQLLFNGDSVTELQVPDHVPFVLAKPFVTSDDRFLVVLTAADFQEKEAIYVTPTINVYNLGTNEGDTPGEITLNAEYTPRSLTVEEMVVEILAVQPCPAHPSMVAVIYLSSLAPTDSEPRHLGLFLLELSDGSLVKFCDPFLHPDMSDHRNIIFNPEYTFCLTSEWEIYSLKQYAFQESLPSPGVPPRQMALNGTLVVSYKGSYVFLVRVSDGKTIARCNVHASISQAKVCSDERTLILGCADGSIVCYVIVDPSVDDPAKVMARVASRQVAGQEGSVSSNEGRFSRSWDKLEITSPLTVSSRPTSRDRPVGGEKALLKQVKPLPRCRYDSIFLSANPRSKTCSVM